ncbi:MAG: type II toxin-antitoxin system RelE/ParE family toxin [Pirellulales bacterium]|nr:type II toxin-antitoxin system RelE/ParE family toxin [Pirellulales bacterium]
MTSVRLLDIAEAEVMEAAQHYNSERQGLGDTFIEHVRSTLNRIAEYPEAFGFAAAQIRVKQVTKFPYAILYHVKLNEVIVLAVMHAHRDPVTWQERIKLLNLENDS